MAKCAFSGKEIELGTGITYVKNDGKILHFRSSKDKKNYLKLKRKPIHVKWTGYFKKQPAKK